MSVPAQLTSFASITLHTESDVEQKLLYPLLTDANWLGMPQESVKTKEYLPPTDIDKGAGKRIGYFPDYSVWFHAFPVLVVEAKSPHESVEEGFREATLYAGELNRRYPSGVNPVHFVLACNGVDILYGVWDCAQASRVSIQQLILGNSPTSGFLEFLNRAKLQKQAEEASKRIAPKQKFRPVNLIGGETRLRQIVPYNAFATELASLIKMYFDSDAPERKQDILERGYVSSEEITTYNAILETYLRGKILPTTDPAAKALSTTKHSQVDLTRALQEYERSFPASGHLQLILGSVGVGKSFFSERYYQYLQPDDLKKLTHWAFINFNKAPDDLSSIETWVAEAFIESIQQTSSELLNLYDLEMLRKIFAPDINKKERGVYKLLANDPPAHARALSSDLDSWITDKQHFAVSLARYLIGDKRQPVIVVFDNVDRRDSAQQLRLFQVAQWFKSATRAFCILNLRDATYERYKREPPIDAYISSVHFYIAPPRFADVVRKRLELAIEFLTAKADKTITYQIPDGPAIRYPSTKLGEYLRSLYVGLFDPKRKLLSIMESLAGKDVRRALEMFTRIILSGHLAERDITQSMLSQGAFSIREATVLTVLMRTDYKYFEDDHGFVTNIFQLDPEWERGNNFLLVECLDYLVRNRKRRGDIGIEGFFLVSTVVSELERLGFVPEDVLDGLRRLLKAGLIIADHMRTNSLAATDSIQMHASGFVHLRLLANRTEYIAGVAAVTHMLDRDAAQKISRFWDMDATRYDISGGAKYSAARVFIQYLEDEFGRLSAMYPLFGSEARGSKDVLTRMREALNWRQGSHLSGGGF